MKNLPQDIQKRIVNYFEERVLVQPAPCVLASRLTGEMSGLFRYFVIEWAIIV